jgi:dihydropteroate synthase
MGILNVTPDSFSDGGKHQDHVEAGLVLLAEGADILDIGGESTRPGATPVDPSEEQRRILPVIRALARHGARVSVDTRNATTMQAALDVGAAIINDVSALEHDPAAIGVLAATDCPVILMHMRGTPQTMQSFAVYQDVVAEVDRELAEKVARAEAGGIARSRIIVDPGLGFAKTAAHSLVLLQNIAALQQQGLPILIGASRKGFIGAYGQESDPALRMPGSIAAALYAAGKGVAIIRAHDVRETAQALRMWHAIHGCVIKKSLDPA